NLSKGFLTPSLKLVLIVIAIQAAIFFFAYQTGTDPGKLIGAAVAGGISGFLAAAIMAVITYYVSGFFKFLRPKRALLTQAGAIVGFVLGQLSENLLSTGFGQVMDSYALTDLALSGTMGALFGFIPLRKHQANDLRFATLSWWLCLGCGLFGGLILALPASLILAYIFRRKKVEN
ncbi:MAG: hypothetical protein RLP02_35605, partial [Coleofasciculus sp. C2-GNP5-27]